MSLAVGSQVSPAAGSSFIIGRHGLLEMGTVGVARSCLGGCVARTQPMLLS